MAERKSVYESIAGRLHPQPTRLATMQHVVDVVWEGVLEHDVSWLGFYINQPSQPEDRRLVLGPHRDSPACSPIGLHGVCGKALMKLETIIVPDVRELGDAYVACNPRDLSEMVVPLSDEESCWGVLDMDSFSVGRFTHIDREGVHTILRAAGFQPADSAAHSH